ncbi:MAG: TonB-dependent receptor [Pseudomonadota bacterium]
MTTYTSIQQTTRLRRNLLCGSAAAIVSAAMSVGGGAFAQELASADAAFEADVIFVQGTKRERQLQDIDDSISVTTGEDIIDRNIIDLDDLLKRVANADSILQIRNLQPAVIPSADSGAAPSVAVYLDNARLTSAQVPASGSTGIWDLEQVEVYRGPQSTRQGENTLAGAIILQTARPTFEFGGRARFIAAEDGQYTVSAAVGGPVVADELAFRASLDYQTADGFISAPGLGITDDFDESEQYTGRLAFLYEPSSASRFNALLNLSVQMRDATGSEGTVTLDNDPFDREVVFNAFQLGDKDEETYTASLEMNYELNDAVTLTSVTTYSDYSFERIRSNNLGDTVEDSLITQELRAQFDVGRFSGIVGAYTSYQEESYEFITPATNVTPGTPVDALPLVAGLGLQAGLNDAQIGTLVSLYPTGIFLEAGPAPGQPSRNVIERNKYALFGEVDWAATDRLTFTGGLRLDYEENETDARGGLRVAPATLNAFPNPATIVDPQVAAAAAQINFFVPLQFTAVGTSTEETSDTVVLPRAGVRYDWSDTLSTAFIASRGYRSGGGSISNLGASVVSFDPETLWNYEVSLRSTWLDNRLRFNANVFYIDWQDQQVQVANPFNPFDAPILNAASSTVVGFEIETAFDVTDRLSGYASIGYSDTEYDEFPVSGNCVNGDCSGNEFVNAPPLTGAIGGVYRDPSGVFLQADVSYRDEAYSELGNFEGLSPITGQPVFNFGEQVIVDAQIGYEFDNVRVSVFGRNLTDEEDFTFIGPPEAGLLAPRVFGGRIDLTF